GSSESLAESLASYDGTVIVVSHNRSFVKSLATQIWNLEDGKLEVYPGKLDEFLYALKQRQDQSNATAQANSKASAAAAPKPSGGAATNKSAPAVAAPVAPAPPIDRAADKDRKRREAELRQQRSKVLKPLKDRIVALEKKIEPAELAQKKITEQLSDPAVYADTKKRDQLMVEFEQRKSELAKLTVEWEGLSLELEQKEAALS
ncbi:MAG: hypothetical protein RLZZ450_209, partial [Pseudomonadota bacterium]